MSKPEKMQVLLRGDGWKISRAHGEYGYVMDGVSGGFSFSLPLNQEDVERVFAANGLQWRWEE